MENQRVHTKTTSYLLFSFVTGFLTGPFFFNWFLLGHLYHYIWRDNKSYWMVQAICFGLLLALSNNLIAKAFRKCGVSKTKKAGIVVMFILLSMIGALIGKWFMPPFEREFFGTSGSGIMVDHLLLVNATVVITVSMSLFILLAYFTVIKINNRA